MFSNTLKNTPVSPIQVRKLRFESLENRELLSVSPSDYAAIRESYPTLDLPEAFEDVDIIEINAQDFTSESLQQAITRAGETLKDDLIVLRTEEESSVFDLGATSLHIEIDSDLYGSTSLVSFGTTCAASLVSSSSDGAFNVVQGDFQLGGFIVVELGVADAVSSDVGFQTEQVSFVSRVQNSSSETSSWTVDYATEGDQRVFLTGLDQAQALILATSSTEASFLTNVYYDADKTSAIDSDDKICWAAASANILWYTGWGQTGEFADEQELFEHVFVNNFSNKDGSAYYGTKWFVSGEYPTNLDDTWSKPTSGGGYYQQAFKTNKDSIDAYVSHSNFLTSPSKTKELSSKLQGGYGIASSVEWYNKTTGVKENAHTITIWGYTYNSSLSPSDYGYYTSLYITDSDDYQSEDRRLVNHTVSWRSSCNVEGTYKGAYVLDGYTYSTSDLNSVAALTGATFLAQRPSKYVSSTEGKPNLYPSVAFDGRSLLLSSSNSSTSDSDTFLANSTVYTNFSFKSTQALNKTVKCQLWLDGALYKTLSYSSIKVDRSYGPGSTNISLGKLGVGVHTLRLVLDSDSVVDEYNENDNYCLRTIYVLESDAVVVTTAKDVVNASDGVTSLREAISLAGTSGYGSTIRFDSSLKGQTIKLSSSLSYLNVLRGITIDASTIWNEETNAPGITVNAQNKTNAFCLTGGTASNPVKLVGLRIINGAGTVPTNDSNRYGGAVYALNYAELVDCVFESNKAYIGGAVYSNQGSLTIRNCVFNKNAVSSSTSQGGLGGAIYLYEGSLNIIGGSFANNSAVSSGAIFAHNSAAVISGTSFVKNSASEYAGTAYFRNGTVNITDSSFSDNGAVLDGGALELFETTAYVSQTVFTKSKSERYGGAVYAYASSLSFDNCEFRKNTATAYGGAVFIHGASQHKYSNCAFLDNHATSGYGETLLAQYSETSKSSLATMRNCTVAGKSTNAIYIDGALAGVKLFNSIVVGAAQDVYVSNASSTVEGYYVLSSYAAWTKSSKTLVYDSSQPLFADANSGDYSLAFRSQALDVGFNKYALDAKGQTLEYDLLGDSRVICTTVDLGAYERTLERTPEAPSELEFGAYDSSKKTVEITWNDVSDVEYYYVVETSTDGKEWKTLKKTDANTTSATLSSVKLGTSYYARVSATNRAGSSEYVYASRYVRSVPTAPNDVYILKNDGDENASYSVLWNDRSTNETYFAIQVSSDGKNWEDYAKTNGNVVSFNSSQELKYVRVAAGNDSGLSAYSTGKTLETTASFETTAGSTLCLKLDKVDAQTILWDFGKGDAVELPNGATIDLNEVGLVPGVSIITAQYVDGAGVAKKSTVDVQIAEASPSLAVETLPSVSAGVAIFDIKADFAGRVVDRNWRVDWGDGTTSLYESTHDFLAAKRYAPSKKSTNYNVTITLLDESGADVETFDLGCFNVPKQTSAAPVITGNASVFEQVFEEIAALEESAEEAIDAIANAGTSVYGPSFLTDVDSDALRKARVKKGFAF